MVIALWIVAIVACCALCGWGIATAVRRSKEGRGQAVGPRARSGAEGGTDNGGMATFTFKLAAVGLFLFVATLMWLPPALHAEVTAAILLLMLVAPVLRRWFTNHVS